MNADRGSRPDGRPYVPEPTVRPRGVPQSPDREVLRLAVDDADRAPLPPPRTAGFDDDAAVVEERRARARLVEERLAKDPLAIDNLDEPAVEVVAVETVTFYDTPVAEALARERRARSGRARLEPLGFLDAHGVNGPGWLLTHGADAPGFLATHGVDSPGWLASLEARRLAAGTRGGPVDDKRRER